ncbi:hypothetical protein VTP01DRAFT_3575 [Rhizomucor pusillus]|uniref:uncharacterized protein n=1 Tax=Rhizomucor pusillus TaxID=4840 RepID=UPI0037425A80
MALLSRPPNNRRALGSSRAVLADASVDNMVSPGPWSAQAIFDHFYRLSRNTTLDFTTSTLGASQSQHFLDPQSLDPPLEE